MFRKFYLGPLANLGDRARIDVVRHRVASRLGRHGQSLLAVLAALALIGGGTLAANAAAGPDPDRSPAAVGVGAGPALADRADAAGRSGRSDRSEREKPGKPQATQPKESSKPKPKPKPQPKPKPKPQPKPKPKPKPKPDWVHPMPGAGTTSCFGWRWGSMHAGVDLASPHGTPIRAAGAGTVVNAGWVFSGYGISVVIDHGNGFFTHYAHASRATVSPGQWVSPGQTIAREGSTGNSTGPHLHFEVHKGMWNQVEPTAWLRHRGVAVGGC